MKTTKQKTYERSAKTVTFQPSDNAATILNEWDKTGFSRSVFINSLLVQYGDTAAKELPKLLVQVGVNKRKGMVRDTGFEPVTPTVSR